MEQQVAVACLQGLAMQGSTHACTPACNAPRAELCARHQHACPATQKSPAALTPGELQGEALKAAAAHARRKGVHLRLWWGRGASGRSESCRTCSGETWLRITVALSCTLHRLQVLHSKRHSGRKAEARLLALLTCHCRSRS